MEEEEGGRRDGGERKEWKLEDLSTSQRSASNHPAAAEAEVGLEDTFGSTCFNRHLHTDLITCNEAMTKLPRPSESSQWTQHLPVISIGGLHRLGAVEEPQRAQGALPLVRQEAPDRVGASRADEAFPEVCELLSWTPR